MTETAPTTPEAPPVQQSAAARVSRRYFRSLRASRLALAAFALLAGVFIVWALPWAPGGLGADGYTPEVAFAVFLMAGIALVGVSAFVLQELARRDRETLLLWSTVYDEATGLHTRQYFFDRLSLECERARRNETPFTVFVLRFHIAPDGNGKKAALSPAALGSLGPYVEHETERRGSLALLSANEFGVLVPGIATGERETTLRRLEKALRSQFRESARAIVRGGCATFGVEGTDERSLVQAAKGAAVLALPQRSVAA